MLLKEDNTDCCKGRLMVCVNSSYGSGSDSLCWSVDEKEAADKKINQNSAPWKRKLNLLKKLKDFLS
jgi:hypothetical protein